MKKFILLGILIMTFVGISAQRNLKDSITVVLDSLMANPLQQANKAADLVELATSVDEMEELCRYMIDYVSKNIKEESIRNATQATFYTVLASVYARQGDSEAQYQYYNKAIELIDQSNDTLRQGLLYQVYGYVLSTRGEVERSLEYYYKAINIFHALGIRDDRKAACYHAIAWYFKELGDTSSVRKVVEEMNEVLKNTKNITALYFKNNLMSSYYGMLAAHHYDDNRDLYNYYMDLIIYHNRQCITIQEANPDKLSQIIMPNHVYYEMALSLINKNDYYTDPSQVDSIIYYLDKSESTIRMSMSTTDIARARIGIIDTRAYVYLETGNYDKAEEEGLKALVLIESLDKSAQVMSGLDTYKFFIDLYEKTGRFEDATTYYKLLREVDKIRYDSEKLNVINEMHTKYEVEQKEAKIAYLELQNKTARKINILIFSLLTILIVAIIFIIISNRLRKKNLEQSIYESALLTELQQTELEKREEEKQFLQQKYDEVSKLVGESRKKAEEYVIQLQAIKHQMDLKPTQSMAKKIEDMISKSLIGNYHKKEYLEKLSNLDINMLEQGYLSAYGKITNMDMKYIICFAIDMGVKDISLIFNVEPASVRTVRYRIKKKFGEKDTFKFLI